LSGAARKMLADALNDELTPEKAKALVEAGLGAMKAAKCVCPNCGKNIPLGLIEDWEKRARFVQIIADQGLGKAREAEVVDPLAKLAGELELLSDDELVAWLAGRG
jgi:hypothetical protein